MTSYAISHKKLTRTIRLELDAIWLEKEISKKLPPFKFDGVDDFEYTVKCNTEWSSPTSYEYGRYKEQKQYLYVSIVLTANVLNPEMQNRGTFQNYVSFEVVAEAANGKKILLRSIENYFGTTLAKLQKDNCIINDKVVFIITATYIVPQFIDNSVRKCKTQFQPFELMRRDSDTCDVQFVVGGKDHVLAHRAFLSMISPVFAAMFAHNTKEAQTGIINITDFDYSTVKTAIDLLYGHPFEPDSNEAVDNVSRFAGKYLIDAVVDGLDNLAAGKQKQVKPKPGRNQFSAFYLLPAIAVAVFVPLFKLISAKFL